MNKKDVLGASAAAGNVQKMKSAPPRLECWKCSKYDTQQGKGTAGSFGGCAYYLIKYQQVQIIVKEF
jgi:hypothetical protein